jgi:protocatechuate 3,4-dioxygenase beta subunit
MRFDRRSFLAKGSALLGCAAGKLGLAKELAGISPAPRTKSDWDALVRAALDSRFNCVRTPESADGPFYYESSPERRHIAEDHAGLRLRLGITVTGYSIAQHCPALSGAIVDIWHTDASGLYSNVGGDLQESDTTGQKFCRGHQITDEKGYVEFDTIVPGWELVPIPTPPYAFRRTTHIHVKVFKDHSVATTQLYFPDRFLQGLYADIEPYRSHSTLTAPGLERAYSRIRNVDDVVFKANHSRPMAPKRQGDLLVARVSIGIQAGATRGVSALWH